MNALEKRLDLVVSILLMFMIPLLYYGSCMRVSQTVLAGQAVETFLRKIVTEGEITLPVWMELEKSLERCGNTEFTLQRERVLYEPESETGSVERRIYTKQKEELVKEVEREGKCRLVKGDKIRIILETGGVPVVYYDIVRTGAASF